MQPGGGVAAGTVGAELELVLCDGAGRTQSLEFIHADFAIATGSQVIASEPVSEYVRRWPARSSPRQPVTPAAPAAVGCSSPRRSSPPAASRRRHVRHPTKDTKSEYRQGTPKDLQTTDQSPPPKSSTHRCSAGYDEPEAHSMVPR